MTMTLVPPWLIDVKVKESGKRGFRIWLPVVLLWPFAIAIGAVVLVVSMATDVILFLLGRRYHHYTLLLLGIHRTFCELKGTRADVDGRDSVVHVTIA